MVVMMSHTCAVTLRHPGQRPRHPPLGFDHRCWRISSDEPSELAGPAAPAKLKEFLHTDQCQAAVTAAPMDSTTHIERATERAPIAEGLSWLLPQVGE
jgi:hypothetical protein